MKSTARPWLWCILIGPALSIGQTAFAVLPLDFESPTYGVGPVVGQDNWQIIFPGLFVGDGADIISSNPISGSQSLQINPVGFGVPAVASDVIGGTDLLPVPYGVSWLVRVDSVAGDGADFEVGFATNLDTGSTPITMVFGGNQRFQYYDGTGNIDLPTSGTYDLGTVYRVELTNINEATSTYNVEIFNDNTEALVAGGLGLTSLGSMDDLKFSVLMRSQSGGSLAVVDDVMAIDAPPDTGTREWNLDGGPGDWNDPANWQPTLGPPNDNTKRAIFGGIITAPHSVVTDDDVTVKAIDFDNLNRYVIAGAGTVNLEADSGNASIDVLQGSHEFQARVALGSTTDASAAAGAELNFNNELTLNANDLNISGDGQININNIVHSGGGTVNNTGTLGGGGSNTITGDLMSSGTLDIDIGGTALGEFDSFTVAGTATLSGLINIDLIDSFLPSDGDTFDIVIADTIVDGGFALSGDSAGFRYDIVSDILRLTFGDLFEADFDGDGDVDGDDFLAWQTGFGTPSGAQKSDGDYDNDGDVDGDDFLGWQVEFPSPGSGNGSVTVPEPTTIGLALVMAAAGMFSRRRGINQSWH